MEKIKIQVLPNTFLKDDGTLDIEGIEIFSGHIAGICYSPDGYNYVKNEDLEKTQKRLNNTFKNYHFSVNGHDYIPLYIENIPKILAMVLNNEKEYNASEKSARYTKIIKEDVNLDEDSIITGNEAELYLKWYEILKEKIKKEYGNIFNDTKIGKLAQENARYMVTVFMPTKMVYTTSFRQFNELVAMMRKYIEENELSNNKFEKQLAESMKQLIFGFKDINLIEEKLCVNPKDRNISLFNKDLNLREEYFGDVYCTNYKATYAELAQAQRHRTLNYEMNRTDNKEYYVPEIIRKNFVMKNEWIRDIKSIENVIPQGEMIEINERGTYENFILKLTERLCTNAQLEIMKQTKETLNKYHDELLKKDHYKLEDIEKYMNGSRCTFSCFECPNDCKFNEGKTLVRRI